MSENQINISPVQHFKIKKNHHSKCVHLCLANLTTGNVWKLVFRFYETGKIHLSFFYELSASINSNIWLIADSFKSFVVLPVLTTWNVDLAFNFPSSKLRGKFRHELNQAYKSQNYLKISLLRIYLSSVWSFLSPMNLTTV